MVQIGQIYADTDKRRTGRVFIVLSVSPDTVLVEYVTTGRRMRIARKRFGVCGRKQSYVLVSGPGVVVEKGITEDAKTETENAA